MKKSTFLFVLIGLVLAGVGNVFAQDNGTNSMFVEGRLIRHTRGYQEGWGYHVKGVQFDRGSISSWRQTGPGIQPFYSSNYGSYGRYGSDGRWVALAMAGADATAGILINNKTQNTVRDANGKEYELELQQLKMQEARELREFNARQEQARWEREQTEKAYNQPQAQQSQHYESPVSYQLPRSRAYVVENRSSCNVGIVQGEEWKVENLSPGRYETAYFKGGDDADVLEVKGLEHCVVSHEIQKARIVIVDGR